MRDNRLTGPDRTGLLRIVTESDDEIELCLFEFFPRLAVGVRCVDFEIIAENFQRESGCGAGFGRPPALWVSNRTGAICLNRYSAKILRAELPVQRNRILKRGLFELIGSSSCNCVCFRGLRWIPIPAISSHLPKSLKIGTEPFVGRCAVLETFEIGFSARAEVLTEGCKSSTYHAGRIRPCPFCAGRRDAESFWFAEYKESPENGRRTADHVLSKCMIRSRVASQKHW